ncbi:alpha/beta fold hydrolase [Amycolatopsis minnesotensis]|uniref:Alpha/beta hydrolase n=1 Tax=Amycolatopsis minnesotensis TaxID=337894 RepID=A0ABN2S1I5_9PSEU
MKSAYAQVNGLNLYYEVHGTGKPLVVLHGGLLTIELSFGALLPELSATRQVIAVELQGHGHTADTSRDLTLANLADDVAGLLDHLGVDRADLFGFSLGGLVAIQVALSHPGRVDRLLLAATHFRSDGYHDEIRDPALWASSTRMPTEADFAAMREAYASTAPDPGHFPEFMAKVSTVPGTVDAWSLDDLRGITAPTLLVIGDHDFVRVEHAARMRDLIGGAQLAVLPGTTHSGLLGRKELVLPLVDFFLKP